MLWILRAKALSMTRWNVDSHFIFRFVAKATTIEVMAVVLCAVFTRNKRNKTWCLLSAVLCENGANDYPRTNCATLDFTSTPLP